MPKFPHSQTPQSAGSSRPGKGKPQLTKRDLDILRPIGEQTAYRFDQLQGLLARHPDTKVANGEFLSETRTSAIIRRWQKLGLVEYRKILYDDPTWVWLTKQGLSLVHVPAQFHDPSPGNLEHLYWINETRALIEDTYGTMSGFQWEGERLMRLTRERLQAQRKKDDMLYIPLEYQGSHRPDALMRYQVLTESGEQEVVVAIEVELSEKSYATWKSIFLELARYYTHTLYYADESIKGSLSKALLRFQNERPDYDEPGTQRRLSIEIHDVEEVL